MSWKVHIETIFRERKKEVYIISEDPSGDIRTSVLPFVFKDTKSGPVYEPMEPALKANSEMVDSMLQAIVDAAWEEGIKPRQIEDLGGELKATKYHLEDMRRMSLPGVENIQVVPLTYKED